jgi:tetratricopeptide (TPR) repeat protein
MSQRRSPEARWGILAARLRDDPESHLNALAGLVERDKLDVAEAGYRDALARFPPNVMIASRYARVAERRRDWAEAVRRWEEVRARFPNNRLAQQALAASLVRAGNADTAEALLCNLLAPFQGSDLAAADEMVRRLMIDHARMATNRGDLAEAHRRWQNLLRQLPGDEAVQNGWRELQALEDPMAADVAAPAEGEKSPHAGLMARFEGLGGTCEFGLVQRNFGAEPLGLFRWVSLSAANLRLALEDRLAGIGEPEFTRLGISDAHKFNTSDTRYGLAMHTFIADSGQDRARLLVQLQLRMRFLRDKLLQDLAAGEKVFLYRCRRDTRAEDIAPIAAALLAYNCGNVLLAVKRASPEDPAHAVRWLAPGVLSGNIRDGRKEPRGTGWAVDFEAWLETCQQAVVLVEKERRSCALDPSRANVVGTTGPSHPGAPRSPAAAPHSGTAW